mgnify:FL=1
MGVIKGVGNSIAASAGEWLSNKADTDPTQFTTSPGEAEIRNNLPFATLKVKFPTTAPGVTVSLPAYLTTFTDQFAPNLKEDVVFGRADPIPTYSNTTRTLSLGFDIPLFDKGDANENLKKLNMLIKNLYPSYLPTGDALISDSAPLVRIKFANLIISNKSPGLGLLGFIKSFSTNFDLNQYGAFIEAGGGTPGTSFSPGLILPRFVKFNFSMGALHEKPVGWNQNGKFISGRDYPYRTKFSFGDAAQVLAGTIGLGEDVSMAEVVGWEG